MSKAVILYGFKYSSCSWRVRAALKYKRVAFEERSVDIVTEKRHLAEDYKKINPAQKVPALHIDGVTLVESMAILQYLEETRPEMSLQPRTPLLRAHMREIVETIVSGIQPLQNVGLKSHFETEDQYTAFCKHHTSKGLQVLEELLGRTSSGKHCVGDQLSLADICLVPQVYNAVTRHKIDIRSFTKISSLYNTLLKEEVFSTTHPGTVV